MTRNDEDVPPARLGCQENIHIPLRWDGGSCWVQGRFQNSPFGVPGERTTCPQNFHTIDAVWEQKEIDGTAAIWSEPDRCLKIA